MDFLDLEEFVEIQIYLKESLKPTLNVLESYENLWEPIAKHSASLYALMLPQQYLYFELLLQSKRIIQENRSLGGPISWDW